LVAGITRYQVDVQVTDGLASSSTVIDADVVSGGAELGIELLLRIVQKLEHGFALSCGGVEIRPHMPTRDHERVPGADGEGITNDQGKVIAQHHPLGWQGAEGAIDGMTHGARVQGRRQPWFGSLEELNAQ
jgi:hypothetical protein